MKLGYISDLHIDFWEAQSMNLQYEFLLEESCDVIVLAGDTGNGPELHGQVVEYLEDTFSVPVFGVLGNHCYYHGDGVMREPEVHEVGEHKIALATLWTNFRGFPLDSVSVEECRRNISDFYFIDGFTTEKCVETFNEHYEFLKTSGADIVVTHFPPFIESVHPRYAGNILNPYFVNNLPPIDGVSLWVHGHTHHKMDYVKDGCRVVANPIGYPFENQNEPTFEIKVVEV